MNSTALVVGLLVPAVLILGVIDFRLRMRQPSARYRPTQPLNEARQVLYWRLVEAFPGGVVLPHMSFGRFLQRADAEAATAGENANAAGGIAHLSADFLVCRRDFSIVAAVMLDDGRSALRADPRHQFVLEGAGIALHRIPATDIPPPARLRDLMAHPAVNDCAP